MEFKNKQITEIYHKVKGQILLATLFEVRGLLDYEIREIKELEDSDPSYAVKRTIKLAERYQLLYLESYMSQFSKAIHRNGNYEIDLYGIDQAVSDRILKEADLALEFNKLNEEVKKLNNQVIKDNQLINTECVDAEQKVNNVSATEVKYDMFDYEQTYMELKAKNMLNQMPYHQFATFFGQYRRGQLQVEQYPMFEELYRTVKVQYSQIIGDSTDTQTNINEKVNTKPSTEIVNSELLPMDMYESDIQKHNKLIRYIKAASAQSFHEEDMYIKLVESTNEDNIMSRKDDLENLYINLNIKYGNSTLVNYQMIANYLSKKKTLTNNEQKYINTLNRFQKNQTDGRKQSLDNLKIEILNNAQKEIVSQKYINLNEYHKMIELVRTFTKKDIETHNSREQKFKYTLEKYTIAPTEGRASNLHSHYQLFSKQRKATNQKNISQNSKLKVDIDKYEALKKILKKDKIKSKSQEWEFLNTLGNYKSKPDQVTEGKLERLYSSLSVKKTIVDSGSNELDKYDEFIKSFSSKKLRQTTCKEYHFNCQLVSYRKNPTEGKLNSIRNNYNAMLKKQSK